MKPEDWKRYYDVAVAHFDPDGPYTSLCAVIAAVEPLIRRRALEECLTLLKGWRDTLIDEDGYCPICGGPGKMVEHFEHLLAANQPPAQDPEQEPDRPEEHPAGQEPGRQGDG